MKGKIFLGIFIGFFFKNYKWHLLGGAKIYPFKRYYYNGNDKQPILLCLSDLGLKKLTAKKCDEYCAPYRVPFGLTTTPPMPCLGIHRFDKYLKPKEETK